MFVRLLLTFLAASSIVCSSFGEQFQAESRILGGQNLTDDEIYPFMVSVRYLDRGHACGGSIITKRSVLTAAHCLETVPENIVVIAGTNYLDKGGTRYRAQSFIVHPLYNETEISNDISMVIINRDFVYTPTVQPIKYATEFLGGGMNVFRLGWGKTSNQGELSNVLKYLDSKTMTNAQCASEMGPIFGNMIFESSLCDKAKPGDGFCGNDSGSPLVHNNQVVGLNSWILDRCGSEYPLVTVRVAYYANWIQENMVE